LGVLDKLDQIKCDGNRKEGYKALAEISACSAAM